LFFKPPSRTPRSQDLLVFNFEKARADQREGASARVTLPAPVDTIYGFGRPWNVGTADIWKCDRAGLAGDRIHAAIGDMFRPLLFADIISGIALFVRDCRAELRDLHLAQGSAPENRQ
jgi:hypothetical protein